MLESHGWYGWYEPSKPWNAYLPKGRPRGGKTVAHPQKPVIQLEGGLQVLAIAALMCGL
jgi:hypothetical protein